MGRISAESSSRGKEGRPFEGRTAGLAVKGCFIHLCFFARTKHGICGIEYNVRDSWGKEKATAVIQSEMLYIGSLKGRSIPKIHQAPQRSFGSSPPPILSTLPTRVRCGFCKVDIAEPEAISLLQMMDLDRDGVVSVDDFMVRLFVGNKNSYEPGQRYVGPSPS